jgi:hypothetical protein
MKTTKPSKMPKRILITAQDATILNHFQEIGFPKVGRTRRSRRLLKLLSKEATPISSSIETYFVGHKSNKKGAH